MHPSEYEHAINRVDTIWSWWLFVNICKISVHKYEKSLINLKYSVAEYGAET